MTEWPRPPKPPTVKLPTSADPPELPPNLREETALSRAGVSVNAYGIMRLDGKSCSDEVREWGNIKNMFRKKYTINVITSDEDNTSMPIYCDDEEHAREVMKAIFDYRGKLMRSHYD